MDHVNPLHFPLPWTRPSPFILNFWIGREMIFFWEGRVWKRKHQDPCSSEVCRCTFVFSSGPEFMLYIMYCYVLHIEKCSFTVRVSIGSECIWMTLSFPWTWSGRAVSYWTVNVFCTSFCRRESTVYGVQSGSSDHCHDRHGT